MNRTDEKGQAGINFSNSQALDRECSPDLRQHVDGLPGMQEIKIWIIPPPSIVGK